MEFTFKLQPGLRASFGELHGDRTERTKPDFIDMLQPWKPGERYSPAKLDEFRARLAETGLFDSAVDTAGARAAHRTPPTRLDARGCRSRS